MLCYRDMTFCGSDCVTSKCERHFGPPQKAAAQAWAKRVGIEGGAPVAFADFSADCKEYRKPRSLAPNLRHGNEDAA